MKTTIYQRFKIALLGPLKVGYIKKPGWKDKFPLYMFRCSDCGRYSTSYASGYEQVLNCEHCRNKNTISTTNDEPLVSNRHQNILAYVVLPATIFLLLGVLVSSPKVGTFNIEDLVMTFVIVLISLYWFVYIHKRPRTIVYEPDVIYP